MTQQALFRQMPAVDKILSACAPLIEIYGHEQVVAHSRDVLQALRQAIQKGQTPDMRLEAITTQVEQALEIHFSPSLRRVINGTGVIIHTNLGRAPLSTSAQQAIQDIATHYNTLEFNLETGKRGSRYTHAEQALCEITGAEGALVVNNNASALILFLSALAQNREVIISRSQAVEIGGGFRIPDIMRQSGSALIEVGTTNRTRVTDYTQAITDETSMLLRVHSSNFAIVGFVESPSIEEMAHVAHEHNVLCVDDIGSGALLDTSIYGLSQEPMVQTSIQAGVDLVAFSGDKLLGATQAGILVGKSEIIQRLKKHPLARALRADKLAYTGLQATLDHYRRGEATTHIPIWRMMSRSVDDIEQQALAWAQQFGDKAEVIDGESTVGGGSLPGKTLPTKLLALTVDSAENTAYQLRHYKTPVIPRIIDNRIIIDPRTVLEEDTADLLQALKTVMV